MTVKPSADATNIDSEPDVDAIDDVDADSDSTAAESSSAESATAEPSAAKAADVPRWQKVLAAVLAAVIVGAGVGAGIVWNSVATQDRRDARNAKAVEAAKEMVVAITTLKHGDLSSSVNEILAHATGKFRNQFADSSAAFESALRQGEVDSVGRVDAAGLVRGDGNTAEVLVAASSTVKNSQAPQGDPRVYRIEVSLQRQGDDWLVSNMEFVA